MLLVQKLCPKFYLRTETSHTHGIALIERKASHDQEHYEHDVESVFVASERLTHRSNETQPPEKP